MLPFPCSTAIKSPLRPWLGLRCGGWKVSLSDANNYRPSPGLPRDRYTRAPPLGGARVYLSRAPPMHAIFKRIFQSFVSPCLSSATRLAKGENWFRDQIATNTGSAPHSSHTLAPPLPASLSVTSGGRVPVYISGRQIIRLLLLPDIKNIRQAGRADTNPLLETAGNHFRQVNPPPLDGQLSTRKRVASPGGCPDTF